MTFSDHFFRPFNKYQSRVCYTENYKILSLKHYPNNDDGTQLQRNLQKDPACENVSLQYIKKKNPLEFNHVKISSLKVVDQYFWLSSV